MHVLLILLSLLLAVLGSYATLSVLRGVECWRRRRRLELLVLAAPAVSLGVGVIGLFHFMRRVCFLSAPPWDDTLSIVLPAAIGLVVLGAIVVGVIRLGLLSWTVTRRTTLACPDLQGLAERLARHLGAPRPQVRLYVSPQPLALSCGLWRPTVLLSTWMVDHLDAQELESVLAHELAHATHQDYPLVWLATVLRDAFFYLPTSRAAYRRLQADKELASDDLAVSVTQRPLALASALAKVWQQALGGAALGAAQAFVEEGRCIERRIERLLEDKKRSPITSPSRAGVAGVGASALIGLLALQAGGLIVMLLDPMSCGPASPLWRIF